jgi:hypothetical protein
MSRSQRQASPLALGHALIDFLCAFLADVLGSALPGCLTLAMLRGR